MRAFYSHRKGRRCSYTSGTVIKETSYRTVFYLTITFSSDLRAYAFFSQSRDIRHANGMKKIEERKRRAKQLMREVRGKTARRSSRRESRNDYPRNEVFPDRETIVSRRRRVYAALSTPRSREIPHFGSALRFCIRDTENSARRASGSEKLHTHASVVHRSKRRDKTRIICGRRTELPGNHPDGCVSVSMAARKFADRLLSGY